jgi:hypothetical protein
LDYLVKYCICQESILVRSFIKYVGKIAPEVKSNVRKQRDADSKKDSDSGSCSSSDDGGRSERRGIKGSIKKKMSEEHEILQRRESLMREGILRKCSLLNALKQKYEQVCCFPSFFKFNNIAFCYCPDNIQNFNPSGA